MITSLVASFALLTQGASLTAETRKVVVETLGSSMHQWYAFPDLGDKVQALLKERLAAGAYDAAADGPALAKQLSQEVNAVIKDAHFRVLYSQKGMPPRAKREEPTAAENAQRAKFTKLINAGVDKVQRLDGNVGYIKIDGFMERELAARPIQAAMDFVSETDALIIDLRFNGGGSPDTVRLLCSYFFGPKPVHLNDIYMRPENKTDQFWTLAKVPGRRYEDKPVYLLTGKRTGSGAEEFAYDLKNLKRAILVGTSTWGGANPGGMVRLDDHFGAFIPMGRAINPYTHTNWEGTGVEPDVHVDADKALDTAHRLAVEKLLAAAKTDEDKERLSGVAKDLREK